MKVAVHQVAGKLGGTHAQITLMYVRDLELVLK